MDIKEKIEEMKSELNRYNYYYYTKSRSLVDDQTYDIVIKRLEELEEQYPEYKTIDSPTQRVGSSLTNTKFAKVTHRVPMLSLENTYDDKDLNRFYANYAGGEKLALELKLDGLSISLIYKAGKLVQALTRGDGAVGEDVTENAMQIESIPHYLTAKMDVEVRGEIVMPISAFEEINAKRIASGEEPHSNPRNAAAGAMRRKDANAVKDSKLDCYFYQFVNATDFGLTKHDVAMHTLRLAGLKISDVIELVNSENVKGRLDFWESKRKELDFETDGMVIKINDLAVQKNLGLKSKTPKWAVAYKFAAEKVITKLNGVTWQIGRTGKLTPVAELEEVELAGTKVRRASMHNFEEVQRLGVKIGDNVYVEKAAEIIPQVCGRAPITNIDENYIEITMPTTCPECGGDIAQEEGQVDYRCTNPNCSAKLQGYIEYFVGRDAMNILGLGGKMIKQLIEAGLIRNVRDLYHLHMKRDELLALDRQGEKSIDNILFSIENSKNQPFQKVLYALGIQHIGRSVSKQLTDKYHSIVEIRDASKEELMQLEGFGEKMAESLYSYLHNSDNWLNIVSLSVFLDFDNGEIKEEEVTTMSRKLEGKTFLATGKLEHFTRESIMDKVAEHGGINLRGVTAKLNYLIVGEKAGSKLTKAEDLGTVKILDEKQFLEMIEEA
jgi:DNA ligase (NAD+)